MSVINQIPTLGGDWGHDESSSHAVDTTLEDNIARAAIVALTAFFRYCFQLHCFSLFFLVEFVTLPFFSIHQGWW